MNSKISNLKFSPVKDFESRTRNSVMKLNSSEMHSFESPNLKQKSH